MSFKVYYEEKVVFDNLDIQVLNEMYAKGWITTRQDGNYDFKYNEEHKHLFHRKTPMWKRMEYFKRMNEVGCKCEDCGKSPSLHIRPDIDKDGKVNFKKIICVCKECRTKKLKKEDILVPQFRKSFSNTTLDKKTEVYLKKKYPNEVVQKLMNNEEFLKLRRLEKRTYSLTKIPLPPLPKKKRSKEQELQMLHRVGIENIDQDLDLEDKETRIKVRKFLSYESFYLCPCCGKKTEYKYYTIDHIHPKSKGGPNTIRNFIGMCKKCNTSKGDFTVLEYLQRVHFKALPYRVLKIAYREQERVKKELRGITSQRKYYEDKLVTQTI